MQKEPEKLDWNLAVKCDHCDGYGYQMQKTSSPKQPSKKEKVKCPRCFGRGVMNKRT